jgi:hypothetical protein
MSVKDLTTEDEVLATAAHLIECYGQNDTHAYLACFALNATFDFYFLGEMLMSRIAWTVELVHLESKGVRVLSCTSSHQHVRILSSTVALFHHDVVTVETSPDKGEETLSERETIIFVLGESGRWLAVHEHLTEMPH